MELNTAQISALRSLDPEDEYAPSFTIHPKTLAFLERNGLVVYECESHKPALSPFGRQHARDHVKASGNGPEDLKARFSFLGGR